MEPRPTREPRPRETLDPPPSDGPPPSGEPPPSDRPPPSDEPRPSDDGGGLPACRYRDLPTRHAGQDDWAITLLDTIYRLPSDFVPDHLVSTARAGLQAGYEIRPEVVDDLRAMAQAAEADGAPIAVRWAYRSYGEQAGAFAYWERVRGRAAALRISARPGHSEHQLGTAIDFRSADSLKPPWGYEDWGTTPAGRWMARESWRYGFILSFPRGMEEETCYAYEPWHFRYMGRDLASRIHESGVSIRRYLWEHFHSASSD